jgi:hypothetical protein
VIIVSSTVKTEMKAEETPLGDIMRDLDLLDYPIADESLASKLISSFVVSNYHDPARDYLPESCFTRLITEANILEELMSIEEVPNSEIHKRYDRNRRKALADWIRTSAQRTFAIVVQ